MSRAIRRDSTDMIASRELLGKVGAATEWEKSKDNTRKAKMFSVLALAKPAPVLKCVPAQPGKRETDTTV